MLPLYFFIARKLFSKKNVNVYRRIYIRSFHYQFFRHCFFLLLSMYMCFFRSFPFASIWMNRTHRATCISLSVSSSPEQKKKMVLLESYLKIYVQFYLFLSVRTTATMRPQMEFIDKMSSLGKCLFYVWFCEASFMVTENILQNSNTKKKNVWIIYNSRIHVSTWNALSFLWWIVECFNFEIWNLLSGNFALTLRNVIATTRNTLCKCNCFHFYVFWS